MKEKERIKERWGKEPRCNKDWVYGSLGYIMTKFESTF